MGVLFFVVMGVLFFAHGGGWQTEPLAYLVRQPQFCQFTVQHHFVSGIAAATGEVVQNLRT